MLLEAKKDTKFLHILQHADFLTNDGIGLYIGYQIQDFFDSRMTKHPNTPIALWERGWGWGMLPYYFFNLFFRRNMLYKKYGERICGSDLTLDIVKYAQKKAIKIVIIDLYNPTDSTKVQSQKIFWPELQKAFPRLLFDYHIYNPEQKKDIKEHIKNSGAQIVFSTLGMKSQEASVIEILKHCPNIQLGLWVGSSFDYIIGFQKRAPKIFRNLGIEWLYRIFTSPGKLRRLRRIFRAVIVFPLSVLFDK